MGMGRLVDSSLYELLEVSQSATAEEIEASYQRLVGVMAPDSLAMYAMVDEGEADRLRAQVEEAYRTLSDPDRRSEYDRSNPEHAKSHYPHVMLPESANNSNMSVAPARREREERAPVREEYARDTREEYARDTREERSSDRYREDARPIQPPAAATAADSDESSTKPAATRPAGRAPEGVLRKGRLLQPSMAIEVTSDTECSGSLLRRLRESANANLDAVADITKISKRYLHALEENDFDTLPAAVYVRGFVSEYARALGLDPTLVAKSYMSLYKRYRGEGS